MAKKKGEPIKSLGNEDKLTVQKSLPLFSLWRSNLTLAEFKILDTYLARINSHKPEERAVVFEKGELEKLFGVKRIRIEELDERLTNLGTPIRLDDSSSKNKKFARVSLFEKSVAEQGEKGLWQVELMASPTAMKYFFNVENIGYLRYKLRCITSLRSRYTYIMFNYLEHNRFRKSWEVPLGTLKEILDCDQVKTYSDYKEFNKQVLKRVQKEMHEKTECRYTYESIKKGRTVVAIRFTVETLADIEPEPLEEVEVPEITAEKEPWETPLEAWGLTAEEKAEIKAVLLSVPENTLPPAEEKEVQFYHYINQKATEIERRNAKNSIKNKYSYLLKLIKNDLASKPTLADAPPAPKPQNRFNAFPQREYTSEEVAELEKRLLERRKK